MNITSWFWAGNPFQIDLQLRQELVGGKAAVFDGIG